MARPGDNDAPAHCKGGIFAQPIGSPRTLPVKYQQGTLSRPPDALQDGDYRKFTPRVTPYVTGRALPRRPTE